MGILSFGLLFSAAYLTIGLRPSLWTISAGSFLTLFTVPLINGCSDFIWQTKVPTALQGRVFAVRRLVAQATLPVAFLAAGPLADWFFEPLLISGGLAELLGPLWGVGPGRGIGLLYGILGLLAVMLTMATFRVRRLSKLEEELPDHVD